MDNQQDCSNLLWASGSHLLRPLLAIHVLNVIETRAEIVDHVSRRLFLASECLPDNLEKLVIALGGSSSSISNPAPHPPISASIVTLIYSVFYEKTLKEVPDDGSGEVVFVDSLGILNFLGYFSGVVGLLGLLFVKVVPFEDARGLTPSERRVFFLAMFFMMALGGFLITIIILVLTPLSPSSRAVMLGRLLFFIAC